MGLRPFLDMGSVVLLLVTLTVSHVREIMPVIRASSLSTRHGWLARPVFEALAGVAKMTFTLQLILAMEQMCGIPTMPVWNESWKLRKHVVIHEVLVSLKSGVVFSLSAAYQNTFIVSVQHWWHHFLLFGKTVQCHFRRVAQAYC